MKTAIAFFPLLVLNAPARAEAPAPDTLVEYTLRLTSQVAVGVSDIAVSSARGKRCS